MTRSPIRKQRRLAAAVVLVPPLATTLAITLAWHRGLSAASVIALASMYSAGLIGITVGYHRYFAHRSFTTGRFFRNVLAVLGSINAQGPLIFWVSVHRRHHAMSDEPGDPFSPNLSGAGLGGTLRGIWHAYIGWMFADDPTDPARFSRDLLADRSLLAINNLYPVWVLLGLAVPAVATGLWTASWIGAAEGLLWGGFVRMFLVNQAIWSVGTWCHLYGTRRFATGDLSANNYLVALASFGEGLHNNHHAYPSSALLAVRWWEPDVGGWFIRGARAAGLIRDLNGIPPRRNIGKEGAQTTP